MPKTKKFFDSLRVRGGGTVQSSALKKIRLSFEMCIPGRKFVVMNHGYNRGQP